MPSGRTSKRPASNKAHSEPRARVCLHEDVDDVDEGGGSRAKRSKVTLEAPNQQLPMAHGCKRYDASAITVNEALEIYNRDQLLWVKLDQSQRQQCAHFELEHFRRQYRERKPFFERKWNVENIGTCDVASLSANAILDGKRKGKGGKLPDGSFYVATILQRDESGMREFFKSVPVKEPAVLGKAVSHDDGVWIFCGKNAKPAVTSKKEKVEATDGTLEGRPEHTDAVDHAGTWHVQMRGNKTWFIRPVLGAPEWHGSPPVLTDSTPGVVRVASACTRSAGGKGSRGSSKGSARFCVRVEQGDLFIINTRVWYHQTKIEPQNDREGLSISYARDFFFVDCDVDGGGDGDVSPSRIDKRNAETQIDDDDNDNDDDDDDDVDVEIVEETVDQRLIATRNFRKGQVVLTENEIPDALACSEDPNCELVDRSDGEEVMRALNPIAKGECFTIGGVAEQEDDDDDGSDDDCGEKTNDSLLDPRLVATRNFRKGQVVLTENEIPDALAYSEDPNCELGNRSDGEEVMRALRAIPYGDALTVHVNVQGGLDEEYEAWDMDPTTGEMFKV